MIPTVDPNTIPQPSNPSITIAGPSADLKGMLDQIESDRLFIHVDALERMVSRHVNSVDTESTGVRAAYRYIRSQFDEIQQRSNGRFFYTDQPFPLTWAGVDTVQTNIYGVIQGTETGGGIILVGAHYDSVSINPDDPNYAAPGANDNGSGVAALIEMARVLSTRSHRATIMLVAFAAEEVGRQGSISFVQFLKGKGINVDYMLNMDIIGSRTGPGGEIDDSHIRLYSAPPNESSSRNLARVIDFIDDKLTAPLDVVMQDGPDRLGRYSDHLSFSDAGYAAVRFIESLEDIARQHTPADRSDDVQADYLRRSTQTILTSIIALADGPRPPRNISLRDTGNGKRTLVWEPVADAASYIIALRQPTALVFYPSFTWVGNSVEWDGFISSQFATVVIYSVDRSGLMGPPSPEYPIP